MNRTSLWLAGALLIAGTSAGLSDDATPAAAAPPPAGAPAPAAAPAPSVAATPAPAANTPAPATTAAPPATTAAASDPGCAAGGPSGSVAWPIGAAEKAIGASQTGLALGLLAKLSPGGSAETVTVSPTGLTAVLTALELGADEPMRKGIEKVLGGEKTPAKAADLRRALRRLGADKPGTGPLAAADALFVDEGLGLKPGIAETLLAEAGVPVRAVALTTDAGVKAVNGFVSDATKGLIPTILDTPGANTAMVAVNAFHFRDCWAVPFDPADTRPMPFTGGDGKKAEVPTMRLDGKPVAMKAQGRFAAVELPYRDARYAMTLVTTTDAPADAAAFAKAPAPALLAGEGLAEAEIELSLPGFSAENSRDLLPLLKQAGLGAGLASPKGLAGFAEGLSLSAMLQKTVVAVDEAGTVAAGATAAVVTRSAGPRLPRVTFDKPFVFALRHKPTGLVVMAGYVGLPKAAAK